VIVIGSEANLESDVDAGANQKHLQHEVVEGAKEEFPERSPLGWILSVRTEVTSPLLEVSGH